MTNEGLLNQLKAQIREELDREADEIIDEVAERILNELKLRKYQLVGEMLKNIDFIVSANDAGRSLTFQINFKSEGSDVK